MNRHDDVGRKKGRVLQPTESQAAAVGCDCERMADHGCECGATLRRLLFGMPDARDVDAGLLDEVVLGGCMVRGGGSDPNLACADCDRRYVRFGGHVFPEKSWLAPIHVAPTEAGALQVLLRDRDGHRVSLQVTRENQVFVHFSVFSGKSCPGDDA